MESKKTHWKKNFNYNYLGSYSLNQGQEVTLTIDKVVKESVTNHNGSKEDCTVAYFKESINGESKPMILNKTNCKTIESLYSTPFIEEWKNKKVTIYVQDGIKAFGDVVEALRIKKKKPVTNKPKLTPDHPKWSAAALAVTTGATKESIRKHWDISDSDFDKLEVESKTQTA